MLLANLFPELSVNGPAAKRKRTKKRRSTTTRRESTTARTANSNAPEGRSASSTPRLGSRSRDWSALFESRPFAGAHPVAQVARPTNEHLDAKPAGKGSFCRRSQVAQHVARGAVAGAGSRALTRDARRADGGDSAPGPSAPSMGSRRRRTRPRGELARRLRSADTTAKLSGLVPELSEDGGAEADEEQDEEENDEGETRSEQPFASARRFLDESSSFTVTETVGDIRAVSLRRAPALVEWLAARTELSERVLRSRFKKAHGRTLLRTILTDVWPLRVTGPSGVMLADLTTGAVCLSPSLLRWVADVAGVGVGDARQRVEAAHGNTRLARALPQLCVGQRG